MIGEPVNVADLATLLARAYLRLQAHRTTATSQHPAPPAQDDPGLDVPGRSSDGCPVVNSRRAQ